MIFPAVWAGPRAPGTRNKGKGSLGLFGAGRRVPPPPIAPYMGRMTETPSSNAPSFDDIAADFAFIDDWDEKYRYLIDLGARLPALADDAHQDDNKVRGCASQVWLTFDRSGDQLFIQGDSDAAIVKGLVAIMITLYTGQTPAGILAIDATEKLATLELQDHITPQRSNGVASMIKRIRAVAEAMI